MHPFLLSAIGLVFLRWTVKLFLETQNIRHSQHIEKSGFDPATVEKSVAYTLDKHKFQRLEISFDALFLIFILLSGFLPWSFQWVVEWLGLTRLSQALYLLGLGMLLSLPHLPFELWHQFVIEARYGFNKSSFRLWVMDKVKGLVVSLVLMLPLLYTLLLLVESLGRWWWLWGFATVLVFQLLMMVLYPKLIMPLFNKFTPLEDGELKERLRSLAERARFKANQIQVMDGSGRSAHSNAFFTGFGKFRKIVLFDTLLEQLNPDQLEAVLAHEIGHYKKGHIPKQLLLSMVFMCLSFWLVDFLFRSDWFYIAFGFEPQSGLAPALLLLSILGGLFTFWLTPLFNWRSRKNEYEADAFALQSVKNPTPLIEALRKLSEKNLSNLNPHPLYSTFYYSHPTLKERESALLAGA